MSSCCTFRLKRRRAFSRDSPSCNLTSANETTPPNRSGWTRQLLQDGRVKSSTIWNLPLLAVGFQLKIKIQFAAIAVPGEEHTRSWPWPDSSEPGNKLESN